MIDITNNHRNPLKFIDVSAVKKLNTRLHEFIEIAGKKGDISSFIQKAKYSKYGMIAVNIAICWYLTACALPKIQYLFREKVTGNIGFPGMKAYQKD